MKMPCVVKFFLAHIGFYLPGLQSILVVLVVLPAPSGATIGPELHRSACPSFGRSVIIRAAAAADHAAACAGAGRAIRFLGAHGYTLRGSLVIEVIDRIEAVHGTPILGSYDPLSGRVRVPAWEVLNDGKLGGTVVGIAINRELYISIFTHEVAHAILDTNIAGRRLTHAAHDYVAYSVQLATMRTEERARILAGHPPSRSYGDDGINDTVLALAPHRFAAYAYRHFSASDNPAATLRRVLDRGAQRTAAGG